MAHVLHSFDRTASSISFHLWINVSFVVLFFGGGDGRQLLRPMRFVNMEIWYAIPWRKRCARVHACIVKVDGILTTRSNASITTNNEIIHKRKRIIKCLSFATLLRFFLRYSAHHSRLSFYITWQFSFKQATPHLFSEPFMRLDQVSELRESWEECRSV